MIDSFSVYKGANATAETIRIFTHRRKLLSEATNHCFLPIKKPSRNSPAVWTTHCGFSNVRTYSRNLKSGMQDKNTEGQFKEIP